MKLMTSQCHICPIFANDYVLIFSIFFIAKKKHATATILQAKSKGTTSVTVETDDVDMMDAEENIHAKGMIFQIVKIRCLNVVLGKKKIATLGNPQATDVDGLLVDVDVQSINDNPSTCEDKRQDVDHFFDTTVVKDVNGKSKKYRTCKLCS